MCGEAGPLQNGQTQCLGLVSSVAHVEKCVICEVAGIKTASEDGPVARVVVCVGAS